MVMVCNEDDAPYPVERTKHILRIFNEDEKTELKLQKKEMEMAAIQVNQEGELILSSDGKMAYDFVRRYPYRDINKDKHYYTIIIPEGVEKWANRGFLPYRIEKIYIPASLTKLPALFFSDARMIRHIEVALDHPYYYTDGHALYSIVDGKKILECIYNYKEKIYTLAPDLWDVKPYALNLIDRKLKIQLSKDMEVFIERFVTNRDERIYLSKTTKHFISKKWDNGRYFEDRKQKLMEYKPLVERYRIDEESPYLLMDEDSIYEILEDRTLRLVKNEYYREGKCLIREDTSVIGANSFIEHSNYPRIVIPESVKVIESYAFQGCKIGTVVIEGKHTRIEPDAFYSTSINTLYIKHSGVEIMENSLNNQYIDRVYLPDNFENLYLDDLSYWKLFIKDHFIGYIIEQERKQRENEKSDLAKLYELIIKNRSPYFNVGSKPDFDQTLELKEEEGYIEAKLNFTSFEEDQYNEELITQRVENLSKLKEGDIVYAYPGKKFNKYRDCEGFELFDENGGSLGIIPILGSFTNIYNDFRILEAKLELIISEANRRARPLFTYGLVSIKFIPNDIRKLSSSNQIIAANFNYVIEGNQARLLGYRNTKEKEYIIIPASIEGKEVVEIDQGIFSISNIQTLEIEEGIKRIGPYSLGSINGLRKLILPSSIEYIDPNVFACRRDDARRDENWARNRDHLLVVAPVNSIAEKFFKEYKINRKWFDDDQREFNKSIIVVNEDPEKKGEL